MAFTFFNQPACAVGLVSFVLFHTIIAGARVWDMDLSCTTSSEPPAFSTLAVGIAREGSRECLCT